MSFCQEVFAVRGLNRNEQRDFAPGRRFIKREKGFKFIPRRIENVNFQIISPAQGLMTCCDPPSMCRITKKLLTKAIKHDYSFRSQCDLISLIIFSEFSVHVEARESFTGASLAPRKSDLSYFITFLLIRASGLNHRIARHTRS